MLDELLQASAHEAVVKQAIPVLIFVASLDSSLDVKRFVGKFFYFSFCILFRLSSTLFSKIHFSDVGNQFGSPRKCSQHHFQLDRAFVGNASVVRCGVHVQFAQKAPT